MKGARYALVLPITSWGKGVEEGLDYSVVIDNLLLILFLVYCIYIDAQICSLLHSLLLGYIVLKSLPVSHPKHLDTLSPPERVKNEITREKRSSHPHSHLRCLFNGFLVFIFNLHAKSSFCGKIAALSTLQVLYSPRDYRGEGASASEWKKVTAGSSTVVLFQPEKSTKVCKFKISSVVSLCLTA